VVIQRLSLRLVGRIEAIEQATPVDTPEHIHHRDGAYRARKSNRTPHDRRHLWGRRLDEAVFRRRAGQQAPPRSRESAGRVPASLRLDSSMQAPVKARRRLLLGFLTTALSADRMIAAIEAAFCKAELVTLADRGCPL
jgi:hypothetical protein